MATCPINPEKTLSEEHIPQKSLPHDKDSSRLDATAAIAKDYACRLLCETTSKRPILMTSAVITIIVYIVQVAHLEPHRSKSLSMLCSLGQHVHVAFMLSPSQVTTTQTLHATSPYKSCRSNKCNMIVSSKTTKPAVLV